jgi:hypothetical protein
MRLLLLCALPFIACAPRATRPYVLSPYNRWASPYDTAGYAERRRAYIEEERRKSAASIADTSDSALSAWRLASDSNEVLVERALEARAHRKKLGTATELGGLLLVFGGGAMLATAVSNYSTEGCDGSDPHCHEKEASRVEQASLGGDAMIAGLITSLIGIWASTSPRSDELALRKAVRAPAPH